MASGSNLWIGYSSVDFANVEERSEIQVSNVDYYLNNVEYIVDVHLTRSSLAAMFNNVYITYASNNVTDFGETTSPDFSNAFTYQVGDGKSFDIRKGKEVIGRMPATLRGKYEDHLNSGADQIKLTIGDYPVISGENELSSFLPTFYDENGKASVFNNATTQLNKLTDSEYNNHNLVMSAIPKAISAQLQGFAYDENILRLIGTQDTYFNLLTYSLQGSLDNTNNKVDLASSLSGCDVLGGTTYSVYELVSVDETPDKNVDNVPIGHYVLAHIFNKLPPVGDRVSNTSGTEALWEMLDIDDYNPEYDVVKLSNTSNIETALNLQFILKTKMTLRSRDGDLLNTTLKSPAHADDGEVQILFNFIFDREDVVYESLLAGQAGEGNDLEFTAPFANYSTLYVPAEARTESTEITMSSIGASDTTATITTFLASTSNIAGETTQPAVIDEYLAPLIELTPHGTTFEEPVTLDISYSTAGLVEGQMVYILKMPDSGTGQWTEIVSFPYDPDAVPIVTIELESFSVLVPSTIKLTGAPLAPSSVSVGTISYNSVALSWPPVTTKPIPTGYNIVANSSNPLLKNTSDTNYLFTGLTANTEYSFSVSSFLTEPDGSVLESSKTDSITITTGPGVVSNLTFTNITHNSVLASWDSVGGANRYLLNSSGPVIGYYVNEPTTSQLVQGLTGNTEYTFSVQSLRTVPGSSTISGATTSTVNITTLPGSVTNIAASDVDHNSITLSWDPPVNGGVHTYRIAPTGGSLSNVDVSAPSTTYTFDYIPSNTEYSFTISSITDDGLVGGSASLSGVMTGPSAVTDLASTSGTSTSLSLEWSGSEGANLYAVTNGSDTQTTTSNNITFTGLTANTYYDIIVTSYNDTIKGGLSILDNLITAPLAPSDPYVSGLTGSGLTLTWTGAGGATKYQIIADDSQNQTVYETNDTFYNFTGLQSATTYDFTITSYNGDNLVGESVTLENVFTSPSAVTDLTDTGITETTVSLSWTGADGANKYYVTDGNDTQTTTSNNITFTGLTGNTYYTMKVTSYIDDSVEGSNVSTEPILTAPAAPTAIGSSDTGHNSITLSWTGADGAIDYHISAEPTLDTRIVQGTSNVFEGLSENTTYNFTITSYNSDGLEGGSGSSGNIRTAPAAVTDLSNSVTHDSITLSWTGVDGATDYHISEPTLDTRIVQGTSNVVNGLDPNTDYNFTITSYNSDGLEGDSVTTGNILTAPSAITNFTVDDVTHNSTTISWTGSEGAVKYKMVPNIGAPFEYVGTTLISPMYTNTLYTFVITPVNNNGAEGEPAVFSGTPTYSYSTTASDVTVRNGHLYDTTLNTYGEQVFSQLTDWLNVIETSNNETGEINDSDQRTGVFVDMIIPSEIQASVTASYQEGFYFEVKVDNSSITHINPSKFRFLQNDRDRVTPSNIMLIGKELPSSPWVYIKEITNIAETQDWIETEPISVSDKFSIFRIYLDASDWTSRGVTMTDFDIIGDGYLRSRDSGKGILTAPDAPGSLQYGDITEDSITLTWTPVPGANAYSVTNGSSTKFVSNTNIIIYDQLDGNTLYGFTVTSYNDNLVGGSESIVNTTTAPDEPTNVQNPSVTDTTATLTWDAVDGASKYVVTNGSNVQNTNTNSITFTDLAPNQTYNFTITSYNGGVLEGGSYLISGILTGISAPATIDSSSISKDSITLSWDSVEGATDYYISEPNLLSEPRVVQGTSNVFNGLDPNTTYNFTITSYNGSIVGGSGASGNIVTAPDSVINLIFFGVYSDRFYSMWNRPDGATSYSIRIESDTLDTTTIKVSDLDQVSHLKTGLTSYTQYTTTVTPINIHGTAGESASITLYTAPNAYIDSSNVSITGTDTTMTVTWADSSDVADILKYDIIGTGIYTPRNLPKETTSYTWTDLNSLTAYTFRIVPFGLNGTAKSIGDSYRGNYTTGPSEVTNLVSSSITETSLTLSWTGADGATDYHISAEPTLDTRIVQGTSNVFEDLTPNTTYNFTISSYSNIGSLGNTNSISVTTNPELLARAATGAQVQDTESGVSNITWNTITVEWAAGSDASSYSLSVSPSVSGYPKTTIETNHTFTGLVANQAYVFTITSLNNLGNEGESTTVSGTTAPGKVGTITMNAVAYNNVDLSWEDAAGANNYIVVANELNPQPTVSNSIKYTGLIANTAYNFRVISYKDLIEGRSETTTDVITGPEAVTNFASGEATTNTVPLTWTEEPAATNYSLQISDGDTTTTEVVTGNNYTASNLEPNTSYTFSLQSKGYSDQPVEYYKYYGFRITLGSKVNLSNPLHLKRLKIFDDNGDELTSFTAEIIGDVSTETHGELKNRNDNDLNHNLSSGDVTTKLQTDGNGQINSNDACFELAQNGTNTDTNRRKILLTFADGAKPFSYQYVTDIGFTPLNWMVFGSNTKSEIENANHNTTDVLIHEKDYGRFNRYERNRIIPWGGGFANSGNTIYTDSSGTEYSSSGTGRVLIYQNSMVYSSPYFWVWLRKKHPYSYRNDQNATLESDNFNLYKLGDIPPFIGETTGNTVSITTKTISDGSSKIIFLDSYSEESLEWGYNTASDDLELGKAASSSPIPDATDNKITLTFKINEDLTDYNHAVIHFTSDVPAADQPNQALSEVMAPVRLKIYVEGNSSTFVKWDVNEDNVWERGLKKYNSVDIYPIISNFTGTDITLVIEGQTAADNDDNQANEGRLTATSGGTPDSGGIITNRYEAPQLILGVSPVTTVDFSVLTYGQEIMYTNVFLNGELTYSTLLTVDGGGTQYNGHDLITDINPDFELGYCQGGAGTPQPTLVKLTFGEINTSITELTKIVFKQEEPPALNIEVDFPIFPVNLQITSAHGEPVDWEILGATEDDNYETPDITGLLNPSGPTEIEIRSTNTDSSKTPRISMYSGKGPADRIQYTPFIYSLFTAYPVSDLQVETYGGSSVYLTWSEARGASTYILQTSTESSNVVQTFSAPISAPVQITGLDINTDYTFTVTSVTAAGLSGGVTTLVDNSGLGAVTNLVAIDQNFQAEQLLLQWDNSYQATEYSIVTYDENGDPITQTSSGTPHTFTGLNPNTPYTFDVTSKNGSYTGGIASVTQTTGPKITSATVSDITEDSITVTWPAAPGADQYSVAYRIFNSGDDYIEEFLSTLTYTFTGLTSGTTYQLRISPYKNGIIGDSQWITPTTVSTWVEADSNVVTRSGFTDEATPTRVFENITNTPRYLNLIDDTVNISLLGGLTDSTGGTRTMVNNPLGEYRYDVTPETIKAPSYTGDPNTMYLTYGFGFYLYLLPDLGYNYIEPSVFKFWGNNTPEVPPVVRLFGFGKRSAGETESWERLGSIATGGTNVTHSINIDTTLKCSRFQVFLSGTQNDTRTRIHDFWIEGKGYNSS